MSFKVGQKVVCIYDFWMYRGPKPGDIVTIENLFEDKGLDGNQYLFFELVGFTFKMSDGTRVNYNSIRFRPIDYTFGEQVAEHIAKEVETQLHPV